MLRLSIILLACFALFACMPTKKETQTPTYTSGPGGYSPTNTDTSQGQNQNPEVSPSGNIAYVFKYTGRRSGRTEFTSSELMGRELNNLGIKWHEKLHHLTDGKTRTEDEFDFSSQLTGDIHVFGIHASQVDLSKQRGFCQCQLNRATKVCAPIVAPVQNGSSSPSCR